MVPSVGFGFSSSPKARGSCKIFTNRFYPQTCQLLTLPVLWIRKFLGHPDPDLSLFLRILSLSSKKSKKSLDFCFWWLLFFEDWCKCTLKKTFFVGILKATGDKSKIRIRKSMKRIPESGSVLKCHGFTTIGINRVGNVTKILPSTFLFCLLCNSEQYTTYRVNRVRAIQWKI